MFMEDNEAFKKLLRDFEQHRGAPGIETELDMTHPDVGRYNHGFMSPDMLAQLEQIFKQRKKIADTAESPVNVLTLGAGFYSGVYFTNTPFAGTTNFLINVDVYAGDNGSKMFRLTVSGTSASFEYIRHTDGTGFWRNIRGEVSIYTGTANEINTNITMTRNLSTFQRLKIGYSIDGNNPRYIEFPLPSTGNNIVLNHSNLADATDSSVNANHTFYLLEMIIQRVDEKNFKIIGNKQLTLNIKGSLSTIELGKMRITEIIGVI